MSPVKVNRVPKNTVSVSDRLKRRQDRMLQSPDLEKIVELGRDVVLYPNPILRSKCKKTEYSGSSLQSVIDTMFEVMKKHNGIGLSAIQLGIEQTFFVCNITGKPEDRLVFIDPEIIEKRGWQEGVEGCLSLPFVRVNRKRAKICVIKAKDVEGKEFTLETKGLLAVVVQHEFGHISAGELIIDAMDASDVVVNKKPLEMLALFSEKQKEEGLKKGEENGY